MSEATETINLYPSLVLLREPETEGWQKRLAERIGNRKVDKRGRTQLSGQWYRWARVEK
jgi:hypothetical protein